MSGDQNFQQIWNFRSKDDDIDSTSDDSKSSSKGEPKHDLASALIFVGNDEIGDDPGHEKIDQGQPGEGAPSKKSRPKKQSTTKVRGKKSKTERKTDTRKARGRKSKTEKKTEQGSRKRISKKKKKSSVLNPALLDEFKNFTESILQDLRVKREQMFAQMKEDMQKLLSVKSNTRQTTKPNSRKRTGQALHAKNTESDMRPWNCSDGTLARSIVSSWIPGSNNRSTALEEQVFCDQAVQTINSTKKEKGENTGSLAKQSMYAFNQSDQFAAPSSYMALPSPLSGKLSEQQNTESPFRNSNNTVLACDRRNLMINGMNHSGYISGTQVEVPFPSIAQMGTKYMSFNDQHCTQTTSMHNGFPSHRDNFSRGNNILAWRMNGGAIGISGNGHALSDDIAANNVRNRMHYKANEEVIRYGIQDLRDGDFK